MSWGKKWELKGGVVFLLLHSTVWLIFVHYGVSFSLPEFLSKLSLGPGCISEKVGASQRCCDTRRGVDGVRAGLPWRGGWHS